MEVIDRERVLRLKILPLIQANPNLLTPTSVIKFTCDLSHESDGLLDWNETCGITSLETLKKEYPNDVVGNIREVLETNQFRIFAVIINPIQLAQHSAWGYNLPEDATGEIVAKLVTEISYSVFDLPLTSEKNVSFSKKMRVATAGNYRDQSLFISSFNIFKVDLSYEKLVSLYNQFILSQEELDQLKRAFEIPNAKVMVHIHVNYCRAYPMIYVRKEGSTQIESFEYLMPPERAPAKEGLGKKCLSCRGLIKDGDMYFMCSLRCPNPKVLHMKCVRYHGFAFRATYAKLHHALAYELKDLTKKVEERGVGLVPDFTYEDSYVADLICKEEGWRKNAK